MCAHRTPEALYGRSAEMAEIDRLLAGARSGVSGTLVLRGPAGVGKTALLDYAARRASGMTVLAAHGVESEAELPYAALWDLLRPLVDLLGELPEPQSAALAGALAVGPPADCDQFAVYAATLSLLAESAARRPLLAVLDDVQWMDQSSVDAISFAARRLGAEGVLLIFAVRDAEDSPNPVPGLPDLALGGLAAAEAAALLTARAAWPVDPGVSVRVAVATGGNPLALVELAGVLSAEQLAGAEPIEDPMPVGAAIEQVFHRQIAVLPAGVRTALLVVAANESPVLREVIAAIGLLGGTAADLETAEDTGVVRVDRGRIHFRHPLIRSTVYHSAGVAERRAVHRAVAAVASAERRPWHLAAAALGPDEEVAAALASTAGTAIARRSYSTASMALAESARLTADSTAHSRRLLEAADAALTAGRIDRAILQLEQALAGCEDRVTRAEIQHLRGRILTWRGTPALARDLLAEEAVAIAGTDPVRAMAMLTSVTLACVLLGEPEAAQRAAERSIALSRHDTPPDVTAGATLQLALTMVVQGRTKAAGRLLHACESFLATCDPLSAEQILLIGALAHMALERFPEARRMAALAVRSARDASAIGLLPFQLSWLAHIDFRMGNWPAAYAGAHEALRLAEETRWLSEIPNALIMLATVEGAQGRADDCRAHARAALGMAEGVGAVLLSIRGAGVLGALELASGNPDRAVEHLQACVDTAEKQLLRDPPSLTAAADLVEALIRAGRAGEAGSYLDVLERQAHETGLPSVRAAAARCRGMLAGDTGERHFTAALAAHAEVPLPFDLARTELCYGETLRRARKRTAAREHLRAALKTFEQLGAVPWARRATAELQACGERTRPGDQPAALQLTPQELQVALEVAKGSTNRAAATALFLSMKTVEFHLGNIYRKLDIQSRSQLVYLFATGGGEPGRQI